MAGLGATFEACGGRAGKDRHEGRQTHYSAQLGALAPLLDWTSQMAGFWQSWSDHLKISST